MPVSRGTKLNAETVRQIPVVPAARGGARYAEIIEASHSRGTVPVGSVRKNGAKATARRRASTVSGRGYGEGEFAVQASGSFRSPRRKRNVEVADVRGQKNTYVGICQEEELGKAATKHVAVLS